MRAIKCFLLLSSSLLSVALPAPLSAQEGTQSVGLVLSGGGAKGIAHIGAIKALEDNDIPIDCITGTSMGAIVGGLYAAGYSPDDMMALIASPAFGYMAQGKIDPEYNYYFSQTRPSPQLFSYSFGPKQSVESTVYNPQSLIGPEPMAFGFMEIFGLATAHWQGAFDRLFVPFRSVASDMTHRRPHVFASGDLGTAVRASMSFPLIFQAIEIDSAVYYDGGIFDNFPVDAMHADFRPSVTLGFDVSSPDKGRPTTFLDQLDQLVTRPQSYAVPENEGIKIRIDVTEYGLLDFQAAKAIYKAGYDRTVEMLDSIRGRVTARRSAADVEARRAKFSRSTPAMSFTGVDVSGGTPEQNRYIRYLFEPDRKTDTLTVDRARLAYYRAIATGRLEAVQPTALPLDTAGHFRLALKTKIKKDFSVGAGAYLTSSDNSFLYFRAGYSNLSFNSLNTDLELWLGQSYLAGSFTGTLFVATHTPSALRLNLVASRRKYHESERFFFRDNQPAAISDHEYFGTLSWAVAAGRTGAFDAGIGGGRIYNNFYGHTNPDYALQPGNIGLNLGKLYVAYAASTLDDPVYPTSGFSRKGVVAGLTGTATINRNTPGPQSKQNLHWAQLRWTERDYFDLHPHWSLGLEGELMLSTRRLVDDYYAALTIAPAFVPTPAADNVFNTAFRADNYLAVSAVPVYRYNSRLSARLTASAFIPARAIVETPDGGARKARWFGSAHFFGELNVAYRLPFATLSAYGNYATGIHRFSGGIALGIYITAPKFLQ